MKKTLTEKGEKVKDENGTYSPTTCARINGSLAKEQRPGTLHKDVIKILIGYWFTVIFH